MPKMPVASTMTIKEAADTLQIMIDERMETFTAMGKKAKELKHKLDKLQVQMGKILIELKPIEQLIRIQHPDKIELFDLLIKLAKDNNER